MCVFFFFIKAHVQCVYTSVGKRYYFLLITPPLKDNALRTFLFFVMSVVDNFQRKFGDTFPPDDSALIYDCSSVTNEFNIICAIDGENNGKWNDS